MQVHIVARADLESKSRLQFRMIETWPTYFIDGRPVCLGIEEQGYCSNKAGKGTDHPGKGRCRMHDISALAVPKQTKHGRYALVTKERFRDKYNEFIRDPDLMDLTPELGIQRVLLAENWEKFQNGEDKEESLRGIITEVIRTIEKMEKIQANQVMTASNARYLMLRAVDVAQTLFEKWFSLEEAFRLSSLTQEELALLHQERLREFLLSWRTEVESKVVPE